MLLLGRPTAARGRRGTQHRREEEKGGGERRGREGGGWRRGRREEERREGGGEEGRERGGGGLPGGHESAAAAVSCRALSSPVLFLLTSFSRRKEGRGSLNFYRRRLAQSWWREDEGSQPRPPLLS